jgi:hypothetical protein
MNDIMLPQEEDYRSTIEQAIHETRQAIREALGYIERQEDGPLTMRHALKDIDKSVTAIECEVWYLSGALDRFQKIAAKLLEQRDEALRQRDLLIAISGLREYGNDSI